MYVINTKIIYGKKYYSIEEIIIRGGVEYWIIDEIFCNAFHVTNEKCDFQKYKFYNL